METHEIPNMYETIERYISTICYSIIQGHTDKFTHMETIQQHSISSRTTTLFSSFPELFLSWVTVHRTDLEKAIWNSNIII